MEAKLISAWTFGTNTKLAEIDSKLLYAGLRKGDPWTVAKPTKHGDGEVQKRNSKTNAKD